MFVLVRIGDVHLANAPECTIAVDLGQDTDLQSPVARNAVDPRQVSHHCEFTCKRVPETV